MLTKTDLGAIDKIVSKRISQEARPIIKAELRPLKYDIAKIRKDMDCIISLFDQEYVDLRKRVERIEEHLQLSSIV